MLTAEALIQTMDPGRYLARLRGHVGKMDTHLGHRIRRHRNGHIPPEIRHTEWSATSGTVTLNWGQWTVQTTTDTLRLRAEAADAENLRRIQDMLTTRLENLGRREHLKIIWQQPPDPAA
jgi:hypothetical protein